MHFLSFWRGSLLKSGLNDALWVKIMGLGGEGKLYLSAFVHRFKSGLIPDSLSVGRMDSEGRNCFF